MALIAKDMANKIINNIGQSTDPGDANNKFYKTLCDYIEQNAMITYSWVATNPTGSTDPVTIIQATIKTSGSLSPSGATNCSSALAAFSGALNTNAALWMIKWPIGFTLSPAFVIPTIVITPSMKDNQRDAMEAVCSQIINGIKLATQIASGSHEAYIGSATFISIK